MQQGKEVLKPEAFVGMRKLDSGREPSDRRDCQQTGGDGSGRDGRKSITRESGLIQIHDDVPL